MLPHEIVFLYWDGSITINKGSMNWSCNKNLRSRYTNKIPEDTAIYSFVDEVIPFFHYLAFNIVTVTWFTVNVSSCLLEDESVSMGFLPRQNPGVLGWGMVAVSLLNIKTTDAIVGLSSAFSWTHKRPTCMHLRTSFAG